MSNDHAATFHAIFWEFERNECWFAYENMPLLISKRITEGTFHESVLDFTYSSLVK
ncbi:MAG TPA: hypothetical protein VHQ94_11690 [Pyrinomonadaceae bacterium]|jgi:hypothetical protein|nr:hypothetical protein [Pyrinomonadaceae bacterium]